MAGAVQRLHGAPVGRPGGLSRRLTRLGAARDGVAANFLQSLAASWLVARAAAFASLVAGFAALLLLLAAGLAPPASAGEMSRPALERRFLPPLHVGEKLREVPAWPLSSELEPDAGPVGYVFESIDLAPIPGFEGTPFNLLIAIDRHGNFISVEVLRQHEPVFLSGLGPQPLHDFVAQYARRSLRQDITVSTSYGDKSASSGEAGRRVVLDGVSKATASVRIVNQTVLASALAVARARLGFAEQKAKGLPAQALPSTAPALDWPALLAGGYVGQLRLSNREAEALFKDSAGAGLDDAAARDPDGLFAEVYLAYLNAPQIGRSLLGEAGYQKLLKSLYHGQHVFWIGGAGRHPLVDENFVPGSAPARLSLVQDELPLELRDFGGEDMKPSQVPGLTFGRIFQVEAHAGLDPGRALQLKVGIVRSKGLILPQLIERAATLNYAPPRQLFAYPPTPLPEWLVAWRARWLELLLLGGGLAGLSLLLARPPGLAWLADRRRLARWRTGWLVFLLVFVGWYAQGQLSIVQLTGAVKTLVAGFGLSSFLYDPVSLLLIVFLPISFLLWGRGTFCGWLCPFGALQELVGKAAQKLGVPQRRVAPGPARWLERSRFVVLAVLLVAAAVAPSLAERLVEIEPFKTAITVGFDREWPYVIYALALLALGAVYYKLFCRYLCPLGAFMELGGLLRRWNWLPRRPECGKPCQVCRAACDYDAIRPTGEIDYRRCFQCLDCVSIYPDPTRCVPLIRLEKAARKAPPAVAKKAD